MAGDYTKYQRHYQSLTTDLALNAMAANPTTLLTVRNSSYQIYIQKAEFMPSAYAAGTVQLKGVTTGNIYGQFNVPATAPTDPNTSFIPIDFGPVGLAVVLGESVNVVWSSASIVGYLHVEAYQRLGQTIAATAGASAQ